MCKFKGALFVTIRTIIFYPELHTEQIKVYEHIKISNINFHKVLNNFNVNLPKDPFKQSNIEWTLYE